MSQKREVNSCPDGYRVLSTSELRELLQDETKMDKIVRLSEKEYEKYHRALVSYPDKEHARGDSVEKIFLKQHEKQAPLNR